MSDKEAGSKQRESRAEEIEPRAEQQPKAEKESQGQDPKAQRERSEGENELEVQSSEPKYQEIGDLPETLRATLPERGQHIYLDAYKDAWANYTEQKGGEAGREAVAHRDAMTAVEKDYVHDSESGKWRRKGEGADTKRDQGLIERIREML